MKINNLSTNYVRSYYSTQETEMINTLKADPYWEAFSERACKRMSKENLPYILSQDQEGSIFVVYYLKADQSMQKAEFTLEEDSGKWFFRNGTETRSSNYKDIIDYIRQH